MLLVKANTKDKAAATIAQICIVVENAMKNNGHFTSPKPGLAMVTAARENLERSIALSMHGDRVAMARRNSDIKQLVQLLADLCRYVNSASNGDRDVALTSGFEAAKPSSPIPLVQPPYKVTAQPTSKAGEVLVRFRTHHGTKSKQVYACSGDPNDQTNYQLIGVTTKMNFLATGLDPNKFYWFKIRSICSAGISGFSDPAKCRANAA